MGDAKIVILIIFLQIIEIIIWEIVISIKNRGKYQGCFFTDFYYICLLERLWRSKTLWEVKRLLIDSKEEMMFI